jgi:hypothetical protein
VVADANAGNVYGIAKTSVWLKDADQFNERRDRYRAADKLLMRENVRICRFVDAFNVIAFPNERRNRRARDASYARDNARLARPRRGGSPVGLGRCALTMRHYLYSIAPG